jgi:hypothetical protein
MDDDMEMTTERQSMSGEMGADDARRVRQVKTDDEMIALMDRWVKLGNKIDVEAKKKYGPKARLTHEADTGIFVMERDDAGSYARRKREWVKERSNERARWQSIAW